MKLDAFEKVIRKIVREEIEYSIEKLLKSSPKNENISPQSTGNKQSLDEIRRNLHSQYNNLSGNGIDNSEYDDAPDFLKHALTKDYSELLNKIKK